MNKVKKLYQILCIAGAVAMTVYSIMTYISNESVVSVHSKEFHATPEDVYPSFTLCFVNKNRTEIAILRKRLETFDKSLAGKLIYDNLTIKMADFGASVDYNYMVPQKEFFFIIC